MSEGEQPGGGRLGKHSAERWLSIITIDQAIAGGSNVMIAVLAARLLSVSEFGLFGIVRDHRAGRLPAAQHRQRSARRAAARARGSRGGVRVAGPSYLATRGPTRVLLALQARGWQVPGIGPGRRRGGPA
jgi:hypothetical protein